MIQPINFFADILKVWFSDESFFSRIESKTKESDFWDLILILEMWTLRKFEGEFSLLVYIHLIRCDKKSGKCVNCRRYASDKLELYPNKATNCYSPGKLPSFRTVWVEKGILLMAIVKTLNVKKDTGYLNNIYQDRIGIWHFVYYFMWQWKREYLLHSPINTNRFLVAVMILIFVAFSLMCFSLGLENWTITEIEKYFIHLAFR